MWAHVFTRSERAIALTLTGLLLACEPDGGGGPGNEGGSGSEDGPPTLEVRPAQYTPIDVPPQLLSDGDEIELWAAPQGGHVILASAQIHGLDSEFIELRGKLRDLETGSMITEAVRTVVVAAVEGKPDWVEPDRRSRSQVVHLALCPNYGAKPIAGNPYQLELEITELYDDFETGAASVIVVPMCLQTSADPLAQCECECEADYVLGKCSAD